MPTSALARAPMNRAAAQSEKRTQWVALRSPWAGYTPDLAVPASMPNGLSDCRALVVLAGTLTIDHGWNKLGSAGLPLGSNGDADGFVSGGVNYAAGATAVVTAGNDIVQPVRHIYPFQRFTAASGLGNHNTVAITADTGTDPGPRDETGHLFTYDSGTWTSREFDSNDGLGAVVPGAVPLTGGVSSWVDSTVYPLGVTGGTIGANTIQTVAESVFIFTNYVDQVMYYPDITAGTHYTDFRSYAEQVDDTGLDVATDYYSGSTSIFKTLQCRTLTTFDGRAWYGNTVEGGTYYSTRLRRSIVGNPLIVWPGFEIVDAGTSVSLNGVGAGFIDLEQFKTPIQRILPLGDLLAVYSKDGIAVVRRTGSAAAPYAVQYLTFERGLLSPGAVVMTSPAQHFAILSDGWYLINANGTFQEVGITKPAPLKTGELNYKWKEDFYTRLNSEATDQGHLQLGYDPQEQFIRIAASMNSGNSFTEGTGATLSTANEVWIYDLKNDRVFLDDYSSVAGRNQSPLVWATSVRESGVSLSWAEVTAGGAPPWNALTDPGSWDAISPSFGGSAVLHGDLGGYVYTHDSRLATRDGYVTNWSLTTIPHNYGLPGAKERLVQRIDMEYENNEADTGTAASVTVYGYGTESGGVAESSDSAGLSLTRGSSGQMAQDYAHFRVVGDHHKVELSGTGKVKIHSIDLELQLLEGKYRRAEGT